MQAIIAGLRRLSAIVKCGERANMSGLAELLRAILGRA
jgi:hypothetical protein